LKSWVTETDSLLSESPDSQVPLCSSVSGPER
jgi:hypothetical protein